MSLAPELDEEIAVLRKCLRERTIERDRLRAALIPFAKNADFYKPETPNFEMVQIPLGYLRVARAAIPGPLPSMEEIIG